MEINFNQLMNTWGGGLDRSTDLSQEIKGVEELKVQGSSVGKEKTNIFTFRVQVLLRRKLT